MQTTTISNLRANMKTYVDMVVDDNETIIVPRGGSDDSGIVIISVEEYNSMSETAYLLSSPNNRKRLLDSIAQINRGEVISMTMEEIEKL